MIAQRRLRRCAKGPLASRLKGRSPADSAHSSNEGIPLDQSSSIKPRIPATSLPDKVTSALMTTKTVLKNIQVRKSSISCFRAAGRCPHGSAPADRGPARGKRARTWFDSRTHGTRRSQNCRFALANLIVGSTTLDKDLLTAAQWTLCELTVAKQTGPLMQLLSPRNISAVHHLRWFFTATTPSTLEATAMAR
jgi:hypothetical protein